MIKKVRLVGRPLSDSDAVQFVDADGLVYDIRHIGNKICVSSTPYLYDIAAGNVAGRLALHKFGVNSDVNGTEEVVWSGGGLLPYLSSAELVKIKSDSANDTAAGSGARTVTLYGLDAAHVEQSELLTLNGVTAVTAVNSYLHVFRVRVRSAGATSWNEGVISVRNNADDTTLARVEIAKNQTQMAVWTVPAGKTFYMVSFWAGESNDRNTAVDLYARPPGEVFQNKLTVGVKASTDDKEWHIPRVFEAETDIEVRAQCSLTNASVSSGFEGWYE